MLQTQSYGFPMLLILFLLMLLLKFFLMLIFLLMLIFMLTLTPMLLFLILPLLLHSNLLCDQTPIWTDRHRQFTLEIVGTVLCTFYLITLVFMLFLACSCDGVREQN